MHTINKCQGCHPRVRHHSMVGLTSSCHRFGLESAVVLAVPRFDLLTSWSSEKEVCGLVEKDLGPTRPLGARSRVWSCTRWVVVRWCWARGPGVCCFAAQEVTHARTQTKWRFFSVVQRVEWWDDILACFGVRARAHSYSQACAAISGAFFSHLTPGTRGCTSSSKPGAWRPT